jgi:hypothetical protein
MSQSWILNRRVQIIVIDCYGIKIYGKSSTCIVHRQCEGVANHEVVVGEIEGLLMLNMQFAAK